jgi:hypothetical protein
LGISVSLVFNDPFHWAKRAEEARALAEQMTNADVRARMLALAEQYERLVTRAVARLKHSAIIKSPEPG